MQLISSVYARTRDVVVHAIFAILKLYSSKNNIVFFAVTRIKLLFYICAFETCASIND